ncbi:MAG: hypothetical protein KBT00_07980 [Bacteroidales bacterium]|nr:hypothetical protein [Candidatus Cacconaster merdequi]
MSNFLERHHQKKDIDSLVEMVLAVMNAVAVSGTNSDLLNKKLHKLFTLNKDKIENSKTLVRCLPSLANIYCNGFVDYIREHYPELNDKDIEFFSLIALGASSNCISMVFGYEHYVTFYNKRMKLRKKLMLSTPQEFEDFISDVLSKLREDYEASLTE